MFLAECKCDPGYIREDCSLKLDDPPVVYGVPGNALCDTSQRLCQATEVIGDNFVDTSDLTCRVTSYGVSHKLLSSIKKKRVLSRTRTVAQDGMH